MKQDFFRKNPELTADKKILLAVSTGVDSMVLASIGAARTDYRCSSRGSSIAH